MIGQRSSGSVHGLFAQVNHIDNRDVARLLGGAWMVPGVPLYRHAPEHPGVADSPAAQRALVGQQADHGPGDSEDRCGLGGGHEVGDVRVGVRVGHIGEAIGVLQIRKQQSFIRSASIHIYQYTWLADLQEIG